MFARLDNNNQVIEILDVSIKPEMHPSLIWVECDETVKEGDEYDNGIFSPFENIPTIEELKQKRFNEISSKRDARYKAGMTYEERIFQIDENGQRDMLSMQTQFLLGNDDAYDGFWVDINNQPKEMTKTEVQAFFQTVFNYVKGLKAAAWAHKSNISQLTTIAEVEAYDIEANWPTP